MWTENMLSMDFLDFIHHFNVSLRKRTPPLNYSQQFQLTDTCRSVLLLDFSL